MENQWAVRTRDLCKAYHGRSVVDHLNLHVPHGCVYGFLGPNGAGKSTSMKMMLGLARPTSGSVELLGRKLDEESRIELLRETGSLYRIAVRLSAFDGKGESGHRLRFEGREPQGD